MRSAAAWSCISSASEWVKIPNTKLQTSIFAHCHLRFLGMVFGIYLMFEV